jgi:hypothetical protein
MSRRFSAAPSRQGHVQAMVDIIRPGAWVLGRGKTRSNPVWLESDPNVTLSAVSCLVPDQWRDLTCRRTS